MQNNSTSSKRLTRIVVIFSALIAVLSLYILLTTDLADKPRAGEGSLIDKNALIGGDFILKDQNDLEFNSDKMKGRLSLVYFGFTFCPDICPTSLQKLTNILSTLDKYNIDVLPIFITIDPSRDSSKLLKEYLGHFHHKFIGLTGTEQDIKKVAQLYKVYYAISENEKTPNSNYMLDHSSFVYLMDKQGKYVKHFYLSSTENEIIEYIRTMAK